MDYSKPNDSYTPHDIIVMVAEEFGVECQYVITSYTPKTGAKKAATAKCFACLLLRRNAGLTLEEIGRWVCLYSPQEVLDASKTAMNMVIADSPEAQIFKKIESILRWQRPMTLKPSPRKQRISTC